MSRDPLSDLLRLTEARTMDAGGFGAGGTWALRIPAPGQIVFSAIAKGSCWLRLGNQKKGTLLEEGDVGLLPGRQGFVLGSSLGAAPTDVALSDRGGRVEQISKDVDCIVLSGRVSLHPSSAALLTDVLPPMVHIKASSPRSAGLRWLVQQLLEERTSALPGSEVAAERIAELLFIQILRAHVATSDSLPPGWLRAIRDERVARALRSMHDDPRRPWTLDELAKEAAMSRTRFAVLFKEVAGVAPLAYLAAWRMRLAQRRLREEDVSIAQLAEWVGYTSESAFSHAFKRIIGTSPRTYRLSARKGSATRLERTNM